MYGFIVLAFDVSSSILVVVMCEFCFFSGTLLMYVVVYILCVVVYICVLVCMWRWVNGGRCLGF